MSKPEAHHILFTRKTWRSQEPTKLLRTKQWLVVPMETEAHRALHREIAMMPVPDHFMAQRVLNNFEEVPGDHLATLDSLTVAFNAACYYHKARQTEKHLGELIVASLELQRGFLVGNIVV